MLQSFNRFNPPTILPLSECIRVKVARKAALVSAEANWQLELSKSQELVRIEERHRSDMIKRAVRGRP